jgi:WD40 repeat protein
LVTVDADSTDGPINALEISCNSTMLVSGNVDGIVKFWRLKKE